MSRKKKKKNNHIDESWLLPYSDLLTLLVALFIVLFAMSDINSQKYEQLAQVFRTEFSTAKSGIIEQNGQPNPSESSSPSETNEDEVETDDDEASKNSSRELAEMKKIQESINNYISNNKLADSLDTRLSAEGLLVTILDEVFFDPGNAEVKEDGVKIAEEVAKLLITDPPHQVVISGHTDDVPMNNIEFSSNWELSVQRAINFMTLVLKNESLDPTLFSAKGYGEYKPIVENTSDENRAKNRRVEVLILPNYEILSEEKEQETGD